MRSADEIALAARRPLEDRGYVEIRHNYSHGTFGDELVDFERKTTLVRLLKDRGQWLVDLGPSEERLFNIEVWMGVLGATSVDDPPTAFGVQAAFVGSDLNRMESLILEDEFAVETDLENWRRNRFLRRSTTFDFEPPDAGSSPAG